MITETMMLDQPEIPEDLIVDGQQTLEDMKEEMELLGILFKREKLFSCCCTFKH